MTPPSFPIYIVALIEHLQKYAPSPDSPASDSANNDEVERTQAHLSKKVAFNSLENSITINALFHNQLSYSLLAGEPVRYADKYADWLDKVEELVAEFTLSERLARAISPEILETFQRLAEHITRRIRELTARFQQSYQAPNNPPPAFELDDEQPKIPTEVKRLNPDFELAEAAIDLTEIDLNLTNTNEYLSKLIRLKLLFDRIREDFKPSSLGTEDRARIVSLLTDKTYLFFYKLKKRLAVDGESSQSYLRDGKIYSVKVDSERLPFAYLLDVHNDISLLYNQNPEQKGFEQRFKRRFDELKDISQAAYHRFGINYYKDVLKDEQQLNAFAEQAISEIKPLLNSNNVYERRIARVNTFYFHCAMLTCYLAKREDELHAKYLQEQLNKFNSLVNQLDVQNHHPFLRLACACSQYLQRLAKKYPKEFENEHRDTLACFKDCLKSLNSAFAWTSTHSFIPYQLPFEDRKDGGNDCIWEITPQPAFDPEKKLNLFIANSIILPIDYDKKREEVEKLRNEYIIYSSSNTEFLIAQQRIVEGAASKAEQLKEDIKEVQRNNVATLAIFSAIALFSVGTIQLFHNISTLRQAVVFTIAFGSIICLFVILIWTTVVYPLSVKDKQEKVSWSKSHFRYPVILASSFLILAGVSGAFAFFMKDNNLGGYSSDSNNNIINFSTQQESSSPSKQEAADTCLQKQAPR